MVACEHQPEGRPLWSDICATLVKLSVKYKHEASYSIPIVDLLLIVVTIETPYDDHITHSSWCMLAKFLEEMAGFRRSQLHGRLS